MNTRHEDHDADVRRPAFFHSDRSQRDDDGGPRRGRRDGRGRGPAGEAFDDDEQPGRGRRRPPQKGRRGSGSSDDRESDHRERRGDRRGTAGYDRRSGHDQLRDYPRRHDWRDPEDALDDDELL